MLSQDYPSGAPGAAREPGEGGQKLRDFKATEENKENKKLDEIPWDSLTLNELQEATYFDSAQIKHSRHVAVGQIVEERPHILVRGAAEQVAQHVAPGLDDLRLGVPVPQHLDVHRVDPDALALGQAQRVQRVGERRVPRPRRHGQQAGRGHARRGLC